MIVLFKTGEKLTPLEYFNNNIDIIVKNTLKI